MNMETIEITDVTAQKKENSDRVNVFVNGAFFGSVYLDICLKYGIKKGATFNEEQFNEIILDSDKQIALNRTAKYIASKLKTVKEVKDYLIKKEYSKPVIDYCINKLLEYKYLDDEAYVTAYVNTYKNKYGVLKLKNNLIMKGIDKNYLEEYFKTFESDFDNLLSIANKYLKNKEVNYENLTKLYRYLASRGYSYDEINSVINKLKSE